MKNTFTKTVSFLKFDTWGFLAIANFLVCLLSGIFLAIPFDVDQPLDSITTMLLTNPGASFLRNAHYWSAQLFLIFTILHTWEYLKADRSKKTRKGVWLRLVISLFFVFYVMISGFILKADMDSQQARRIIDALANDVPLIGNLLAYSLIGKEGSYQVLYMQHIATATIFIVVIILEHARTIWTRGRTFFITALFIALLSVLWRAPLHDNITPVVKGPWYFLGLQEILHWMTAPGWLLLILTGFLVLVYFIPKMNSRQAGISRRIILYSFYGYMVLTAIAYFFRGQDWEWDWSMKDVYNPLEIRKTDFGNLPDTILLSLQEMPDQRESCVICHHNMQGFTASHDPQAVGCVACHLGDPYTFNKEVAHRGMISIPGNLAEASRTCGTTACHPEITERIQNTLMTTLSGVVSVDRFVFNEIDQPGELSRITEIGHSPADQHLRDMCANCHLGNPKTEFGPVTELTRGGGCNACHLNYPGKKQSSGNPFETDLSYHPQLSVEVTDNHCFGCHSRSGRIATNYEGWHETKLEADEVDNWEGFRELEDRRIFEFVSDDVHHRAGMSCIDCHNSYELMGDGNLYTHEEYQEQVRCEDCHFDGPAQTLILDDLDAETRKIHDLRKYPDDRRFLKVEKSGLAMVNTWMDENGKKWLESKISGATFPLAPPATACTRGDAHDRLSCKACHTAWAPQCIGCHNSYDAGEQGYDLLTNAYKPGTWVEYTGKYLPDPPVLGIDERPEIAGKAQQLVTTFINGMVLSIDVESYTDEDSEEISHRLYAPVSAHTTMKEGRSCTSCHNDPLAIGYGRGTLDYVIEGSKGTWQFTPKYAPSKYDGLPEDAWIGFMQERIGWTATREGVRPFSLAEQKRILTVGACLACHDENSKVMDESLEDFEGLLKEVTKECVLPVW